MLFQWRGAIGLCRNACRPTTTAVPLRSSARTSVMAAPQPTAFAVPSRGVKYAKPRRVIQPRTPKPKYTPTIVNEELPRGHPMLTTKVLPFDPKEVWSLNAKSRTEIQTGKYEAKAIRDEEMMPCAIMSNEFADGALNKEKMIRCSIPLKQILAIEKENRIYNSIFDVYVDDDPTPIPVMTSHFQYDHVTMQPLNMIFLRWFENKRIKIHMPIEYENYHDSVTLKKGGMLHDLSLPWGWPCWWKGGKELPKSICIDLLHTRIGWNYKLHDEFLPEGLSVRRPKGYPPFVLCTIQGKIRRGEDDDVEE